MKEKGQYWVYIAVLAAFIVLPQITRSCFVDTRLHDNIDEHLLQIDSLRQVEQSCDTTMIDSLLAYYHKISTMYNDILILKDHYEDDVNLMIYKTDAWMAYWISMLAIVMTVPAILLAIQYYNSHKHWKEKFEGLEKTNKDKIDELLTLKEDLEGNKNALSEELSKFDTVSEEKLTEMEANMQDATKTGLLRIKEILDSDIVRRKHEIKQAIDLLKKSSLENRISSIMMCLSSFPDPQMVSEKSEKRKMVASYLHLLYKEYQDYAHIISSQVLDQDCNYVELSQYARLVLLSIKLAVIRSQSSFSELSQDVAFHNLIVIIEDVSNELDGGYIMQSDLKPRLEEVQKKYLILLDKIRS